MDKDNTIVTIVMRAELARKMTGAWYLVKQKEAEEVRAAFRHAISWMEP